MKSDARYNLLIGLGLAFGTGLLIAFLTTIINAHPGEAAGALGSVVGGGVGAGGAALAVLLTFSRERAEERRKEEERQNTANQCGHFWNCIQHRNATSRCSAQYLTNRAIVIIGGFRVRRVTMTAWMHFLAPC
jgi:hypothetical protein